MAPPSEPPLRSSPRLPEGFGLVEMPAVASTNDEAKRLARAGAATGTLVWAHRQEQGRGRRGRPWSSPPGNLYTSLILRPRQDLAAMAQLSFVAALAVGATVSALLPSAQWVCKWPNDVLVQGGKIAGILLETESGANGAVDSLVLGVGINVASRPDETERPAIALAEIGFAGDLEAVLTAYAAAIAAGIERWNIGGFAPVRSSWLDRAQGRGGPVTVRLTHETFSGQFVDVDGEGALIVAMADGTRRRVAAGDVFFPSGA
ncbi:MAG: biotin--[acetyl-CoA-carboxylase] ligase [Azospirillaceae bacterium]|nr:biotin--[acetyl-CoA-carboxylase] ligase [Azospirillaceae bacterium]